MRIALVRHGQTDWNIQRRYQGRQGLDLNTHGREQAEEVAGRLSAVAAATGARWSWLASSDASRAVQTARIVGERLGLALGDQVPDLIERGFGVAEGMLIEEARTRWPDRAYPGAESVEQVLHRVLPALDDVATRHGGGGAARHGGGGADADGVIVTHGTVLRLVVAHYTGDDPGSLPNGALAVLEGGPGDWKVVVHPVDDELGAAPALPGHPVIAQSDPRPARGGAARTAAVAAPATAPSWIVADGVLVDGAVLTPGAVEVRDGRITAVGTEPPEASGSEVTRARGVIVPGFVDMHCHGALGHDFGSADLPGVRAAAAFHAARGATTLIASVATAPLAVLRERLALLAELVADGTLAGIHLEGPYLAPERRGAHAPGLLRHPAPAELADLLAVAPGTVRMVTLAPELPGALDAIRLLADHGVVPAIGHTACTAHQARAAIDAGATVLTHAFNGMPPLHHREPGPLGVAMVDDRVTCELILDGHHVVTDSAEILRRAAGRRLALVSDAMAATGLGDGEYAIAGSPVIVSDGVARIAGGSSLAGSTAPVSDGVAALLTRHRVDLATAVDAVTTAPARALGLPLPRLAPGRPADLVVLDEGKVTATIKTGTWLDTPAPTSRDHPATPRQG